MPAIPGRRRLLAATLLLLSATVLGGCLSPNRGEWKGTFSGTVSGSVDFRIGTRGTHLEGKLEGSTAGGQPFKADLEGRIHGEDFYATLDGRAQLGLRPIPFTGILRGKLGQGRAGGDWQAELKLTGETFRGDWRADQVRAR